MTAVAAEGAAALRKVLILGLDGVRGDCVTDAARAIMLQCTGEHVEWKAKTSRLTVSDPAWTSALTGHWPTQHGVEDDFLRWDHQESPSLFAHLAANDLRSILWTQWKPLIADGLKNDPCEGRHLPTDEEIAADCCACLRDPSSPWSCYFVHLDDPDHAGHEFGFLPTTSEYVAAIEATARRCDRIRAALLDRLQAAADEHWLIIMTTDHGGGVAWRCDHGDDAPPVRHVFLHAQVYPDSAPRLQLPHPISQITDVFNLSLHHLLSNGNDPMTPAIGSKRCWAGWTAPSTADDADYSHHKEWAEAMRWYTEHHGQGRHSDHAPQHLD